MSDKLSLPCDCAGTCSIVLVTEFEAYGDDPQQFFVEFYAHIAAQPRLRDRAKNAWKTLRGREAILGSVAFTGPDEPTRLRDFLIDKLGGPSADPVGGEGTVDLPLRTTPTDLMARVAARRNDPVFRERLDRLMDENRAVLDRLEANGD